MVWSLPLGSVGKIGAYIALESWLFRFRPCSGQGQFTINGLISNSAEILDGKLLTGIFAPIQIVFTTWRSWSTCLQGPCEWIDHDLQVLCVELEQILWLKLESSLFIFSPVRDQAIYCMPSSLILKCHDSWVIILSGFITDKCILNKLNNLSEGSKWKNDCKLVRQNCVNGEN